MAASNFTKKILEFITILKDARVTVSPAETLDAFGALAHIDFTDRLQFKQALATSLIKDYTDIPVFDRCFQEFFEKKGAAKDSPTLDQAAREAQVLGEELAAADLDWREMQNEIDEFLESLTEEERAGKTPRDILNMMIEDPVLAASGGALGMLIMNARARRRGGGRGDEQEGEGELENVILSQIEGRRREKTIGSAISKREDYLLNKYIYQLKPAEVQEMRELIKRFGQKLKNRISLRKRRMKHGGLDVKRTFRFNLKYGGIPFRLYFRDKKIDRPQLVVMCDISSSVNQYSRFMLLLTYTLQSLFSKVRTFAFISNIVEITGLFMEMDPERALNSIFADTNFTYGFGSNYGRCFHQFVSDYSDSLTRKTTVLVLGDARSNNQDPELDSFIKIGERARNLFWLNPEKIHLWNWGDSIAGVYLPHCTEMKEVNTFLDLSEFIDRLFVK